MLYFYKLSTLLVQIIAIIRIFSVTFCLQQQKVTKECRRRRIFAKFLLIPLNPRGWRTPQSHAAKPRPFFGFRFLLAFCSRSAKKIHFLCSHLIAKFFRRRKKWNRNHKNQVKSSVILFLKQKKTEIQSRISVFFS